MDWVKLGVRYYADAKIAGFPEDIADSAEVMFTRGIARAGEERRQGFIPGSAIPELTRRRRYEAVADALVASGLWSRVDGGYQIARWADWQDALDVLAKRRDSDRDRKRKSRAAAAAKAGSETENPTDTSRDEASSRDKSGMSRDLDQMSRDRSRDVTPLDREGERDIGGSSRTPTHVAREPSHEPPTQCADHRDNPNPPPCGRCGDARRANERWHEAENERARQQAALQRSEAARAHAATVRAEIDRCRLCDERGYRNGVVCAHDPGTTVRVQRGAAAARAAIAKQPTPAPHHDTPALGRLLSIVPNPPAAEESL